MKIVFYVYRNEKYLDFQTILAMYDRSRSDLYRYLKKSDVETVRFNQKLLYKWDDVLRDTELLKNLSLEGIVKELG
jgi:hypothetical protein